MTEPNAPEPPTRAEILQLIAEHVGNGLPAPQTINFYDDSSQVHIGLDTASHLTDWEALFGVDPARSEQPHPIDHPDQFESWLTNSWTNWRGWHVALKSSDPITDEHRRRWVDSGQAAERTAYLAREAAKGGEQA